MATGPPAASAGNGERPSPLGSMACTVRAVAWARAFRTTPVVAGLKAEPVNRLAGGPWGTSVLSRPTPSDTPRTLMNGTRPATVSFLSAAGSRRDVVTSLDLPRARLGPYRKSDVSGK